MITLDMVHSAYNEYAKAMDKAKIAFQGGGDSPLYYELINEANGLWDEYKELNDIYESGGLIDS
ncbi:hypothetical protein EVB55_202 [Rhizobium phage RHph_Y68]|uniref:Uncharacterized protein n=1 Tax=Rhizobium phage RHph_Y68 TaxID=2509787 RepID=A0A7S5QYC2_9CAUD|nr:hypothetical protein PP934_gp202 [Rhizobium phage RHph_Y68]QIG68137.1 hypothetical protein EVB55_202 [Rhizobium phage RHph_Y68]